MNISQDRAQIFEDRLLEFGYRVIQLTKDLSNNTENRIIAGQLIRAATSVGANYAEANNAASRQDFRNKIFIAKKEAVETCYWLRLLAKANLSLSLNSLIDECTQLLLILQKIVSTLKNAK